MNNMCDSLRLRLRRMKCELQELRRRGAKSFARQYGERTCARCQRPLGKFWNLGAVCRGCSHRICSRCRVRVGAADWKCTVCHAYRCGTELKHPLSATDTFDSVALKSRHRMTVGVWFAPAFTQSNTVMRGFTSTLVVPL